MGRKPRPSDGGRLVTTALVALAAEAASLELGRVPLRLGGFSCKSIRLEGDDRLTARFEAQGSADWVEVTVVPRDEPGHVFRRLDHCAVKYRGSLVTNTPERRAEVSLLVMSVATSIDVLCARNPGKTIAEALGRFRERGKVVFGRDALRAMLSPEIVDGVPIVEGFSLRDVYPTSHLQNSHEELLELVIDFRREPDGRRLLLVVRRRDDSKPAFATTTHFSISHLSLGAADPPGADVLRALVAYVLQLRDHPGLEVVFPGVLADVVPALLPAPTADEAPSEEILNLAIDADCGQSCAFCSIKETTPPQDGGDRILARLLADLVSNRQRGVRSVRVNGYDPLAHSRILELLGRIKDLGYTEVHIFSPCTRLADPAFCDAVVDALPEKKRFHVPLYSMRPDVHDRIVGRVGAFALLMQAIDNLAARVPAESICLLNVPTRFGLEELEAIDQFAQDRGFFFHVHMPYPSFESRTDRYFTSAPKMTDVAKTMAGAASRGRPLVVHGVVPCVVFRAMQEQSVPPRRWLDVPAERPSLPGTEYRDARIRHRAGEADHAAFHASSIPCPHEQRCVLAPACSGEILRSYAELYGTDELQPVTLKELVEASL